MDKYEEIMAELDHMQDLLVKEVRKVNQKNDLTPQELNNLSTALDVMEKKFKLDRMLEEGNYEYDAKHSEHMDPMYDSYRRGRSPMTGRYVSRHSLSDRAVSMLESLMDKNPGEWEQRKINEWINEIRSTAD